jgi:hypothetical protein
MNETSPKAGPVKVESPASINSLQDTSHPFPVTPTRRDGREMWSRQVSFWSVHEYVQPVLDRIGTYPMVGTPEWVALPDDSPAKIAAVFDAARHWALRVETCQVAECEASRAISAAANWSDIAKRMHRGDAYIPRAVAS